MNFFACKEGKGSDTDRGGNSLYLHHSGSGILKWISFE